MFDPGKTLVASPGDQKGSKMGVLSPKWPKIALSGTQKNFQTLDYAENYPRARSHGYTSETVIFDPEKILAVEPQVVLGVKKHPFYTKTL